MKISVTVKTNSKVESIEKLEDGSFLIRVRVPPVEGRANERIIEMLAEYFKLSKSSIELVSGFKGKKKVFEINPRY